MSLVISKIKIYDLVVVSHEDYSHLGQIISKPLALVDRPATVMVRMVPDDPTTMEEVEISRLRAPNGKSKWVHYAKVFGPERRVFPVDMLRYDFAAPVNFSIDINGYAHLDEEQDYGTDLIIANCTEHKATFWTDARWASFGWGISYLKTLKIENK